MTEDAATSVSTLPEEGPGPQKAVGEELPAVEGTHEASTLGKIEVLSSEFVAGWASASPEGSYSYVVAKLRSDILGVAKARFNRADLEQARFSGTLNAYAFTIAFDHPIDPKDINSVSVHSPSTNTPFPRNRNITFDRSPPLRVFVLGSPRSGTSELARTLADQLSLPWDGEGHAGSRFAKAAEALQGEFNSSNNMLHFIDQQRVRDLVVTAAKQTYFSVHSSASFIDKTPGLSMVKSAPFLSECFPDAYFIFMRRNPIANILSRMAKFGGVFEEHCQDWAASMESWLAVREKVPHQIEIEQERMLSKPLEVGAELASFLGVPEKAPEIGASLALGRCEWTGQGLGKDSLTDTDWTRGQMETFLRYCGPVMANFGYDLGP
jgi:hypothetical protein